MDYLKRNIFNCLGVFLILLIPTSGILLANGVIPNYMGWFHFMYMILSVVFFIIHSSRKDKSKNSKPIDKNTNQPNVDYLLNMYGVKKEDNTIERSF